MPVGPRGEKRPAGVVENAVQVAQIATGEAQENFVNLSKREAGKKGGRNRADKLSRKRRTEIAKRGAQARWEKSQDV